MSPMFPPENFRVAWSLRLALAISLLLHGLVLIIPAEKPHVEARPAKRLEASFAQRAEKPQPAIVPSPPAAAKPAKPQPQKQVIALDKGQTRAAPATTPKWSVAQRQEMNNFLKELDARAPSLAQRSLAMAREMARQPAPQEEEGSEILERLPNSQPVNPFSLEMYLDSLVKKLNNSARFVRNDPRTKGVRNAAIEIRLNPDGSLKSFKVLNAADQHDEIAFVRSVVDQAVPFAPFPPDIGKSAKSLAMLICIMPASAASGGFGFSRNPSGRGC